MACAFMIGHCFRNPLRFCGTYTQIPSHCEKTYKLLGLSRFLPSYPEAVLKLHIDTLFIESCSPASSSGAGEDLATGASIHSPTRTCLHSTFIATSLLPLLRCLGSRALVCINPLRLARAFFSSQIGGVQPYNLGTLRQALF
jgi:hypothetical protein